MSEPQVSLVSYARARAREDRDEELELDCGCCGVCRCDEEPHALECDLGEDCTCRSQ